MTARQPAFTPVLKSAGSRRAAYWFQHGVQDRDPAGHPRYCGLNGMTDLPKYLAREFEVLRSHRVCALRREGSRWQAQVAEGGLFEAEHLVLTAPLPQALELLATSELDLLAADAADLQAIHYDKGLATLALWMDRVAFHIRAPCRSRQRLCLGLEIIRKKGSLRMCRRSLCMQMLLLLPNIGMPDNVRGPLMLEAAALLFEANVLEYACHRWGLLCLKIRGLALLSSNWNMP